MYVIICYVKKSLCWFVTLSKKLISLNIFSDSVVLRIGSRAQFSPALLKLEDEVKPLGKKLSPCPRDLKRTTVERLFRDEGFVLDWCAFRLVRTFSGLLEYNVTAPFCSGM